MKISADLSTFEIVLFKSTMACIHTYFIVHARRGNGNYLCGPRRREGDEGRERHRDKERKRSDAIHTKLHHRLGRAEAREICAQLIKRLN